MRRRKAVIHASILGGFLGVIAGALVLPRFSKVRCNGGINLTPQLLASSGLFAAGIAIFFGYYPSRKASQLNRIEAIRYE